MNKTETTEVMEGFAETLRILYKKAGLEIPKSFDPKKEARRLASALKK